MGSRPRWFVPYEKIIASLYANLLSRGDGCVDVGANKGFHSIPMAKAVGPEGRVYAFEPIPELAVELRAKFRKEAVDNIDLRQKALSHVQGSSVFHNIKNYNPLSGLKLRYPPPDAEIETISVVVSTLDFELESAPSIGFIKIDTEGGEIDVLRGGTKIVKRHRPVIAFEDGRHKASAVYGYSKDDYFELFSELEVDLYDILGCSITPDNWESFPNYTFAIPSEHSASLREAMHLIIQEKLIGAAESARAVMSKAS